MSKGWISLHRSIQDHWLYEKRTFSKFEAWVDLLMMANHKPNKFLLGNELMDLDRGQLITSELKLMDKWGWSKTKVRNFLKILEEDGMIQKKSDKKKTTLTICNYSIYQRLETTEEPQENHTETTKRPHKNTNNNVNNDNTVNNKSNSRFTPPSVDEVKAYCMEKGYNIDPEYFIAFYESKGWMVGKNKMKSWKSCVVTWAKRNNGSNSTGSTPQKKTGFHNFEQKTDKYTNEELEKVLGIRK